MTAVSRVDRVVSNDQPITLTTGVLCLLAAMADSTVYLAVDHHRASMGRLMESYRHDPDLHLSDDDRMLLDVAHTIYEGIWGVPIGQLQGVSATCRNIIFHVLRLVWA